MTMQRQLFNVDTDTGTWTDSGPSFFGEILQARYEVITADTGADLQIFLQLRPGDTGNGVMIVTDSDSLGVNFTKAYRQATHDTLGVAALFAAAGQAVLDKIALANDRVKIVIAAGGDTKTGTFYLIFE